MQTLQPEQATFLLNVLLPQIKAEHKTTLRVLQAVPDDQGGYQPDPRSMTALDLAWHLASAELFFMDGVSAGKFAPSGERPEDVRTPADVAAWYDANFPALFARLETLTGEQLLKLIPFHIFNNPAYVYLQILVLHSVHHRGQLSAYLRPMGGKVPSIYGSSGDQSMADAANA